MNKYLKSEEWYPRYYDGYYFGKVGENPYKYPKLSVLDFRDIMNAGKSPCRIIIDDLVIHTFDIEKSVLFKQANKHKNHHWFSGGDWFDFEHDDEFGIYVMISNNGHRHIIKVKFYDTIRSIKTKICVKEGNISPAMLKIEYNGKKNLKDDYRVFDFKITKGNTLRAKLQSFNPFLNLIS